MAEGARPKVMQSASESSSLPMGELTLSSRALMPSKKSNTAPTIIMMSARLKLLLKANHVAMQPEMRLQQVMALGICFFI